MLDSPEAASGEGSLSSSLRNVDSASGWTERHALGEGEWAKQSRDERRHGCGEHDDEEWLEVGFERRCCGGDQVQGTKRREGGLGNGDEMIDDEL